MLEVQSGNWKGGSWKLEVGSWKYKVEIGNAIWKLESRNGLSATVASKEGGTETPACRRKMPLHQLVAHARAALYTCSQCYLCIVPEVTCCVL